MTLSVIDKAKTKATMMGGGTEGTPQIQPIMVDGEEAYCLLMNPWQEYDLRTATTTGGWLDIQKSLATSLGKNSPIIKGALGMHNNVVLHSHKSVIRFSDYGSGSNVKAARSLFIGRQALACAFGSSGGGLRFDWNEESRDNGNQAVITTGAIFGVKKVRFNSKDFGLIAIDTAAADPNA
jgi:N4-gp56 family major capsid protein